MHNSKRILSTFLKNLITSVSHHIVYILIKICFYRAFARIHIHIHIHTYSYNTERKRCDPNYYRYITLWRLYHTFYIKKIMKKYSLKNYRSSRTYFNFIEFSLPIFEKSDFFKRLICLSCYAL